MRLQDLAFQHAFGKMFVYNLLWEDAEVDERYLGLDEDSTVLSISAAGCGVAGMMSRQPSRIDAVDINHHHLALSALKMTAAQRMKSHAEFYDMFGRGWHPNPEQAVRRLAQYLPPWMQRYWKRHWKRFQKSLYREGLTAKMLRFFRKQTGIDAAWLKWVDQQPFEERWKVIDEWITPVMQRPVVKAFLDSPLQLMTLGINFEQKDRYVAQEEVSDIVGAFRATIQRIATTDLSTNWLAWYVVTGGFEHENPEAVPPYLRKDRHVSSVGSPTSVRFHQGNLFKVLAEAGSNTWSHFTFCDAPDWMAPTIQRQLFDEVIRTGREGAVVLMRSVEERSIVDNLDYGSRLQRIDDVSDLATAEDRSKLYRRVDFYRLVH
ncbi:MAG TPA: DUF3419 family protein [Myxococcales bacterium LLY-WYZ-16_1]|nr:DUF3419 family protein [Myxococcales bacterium LLY-WYZ-16_1]